MTPTQKRPYQTHGMRHTPEWKSWQKMIERCENPNGNKWKDYGGRGIRIAPEWRHDFAAFYAHIGPRPSTTHTVDRINPDGHYEPGNVRWATKKEQRANCRPSTLVGKHWLGKKRPDVSGESNKLAKLTEDDVRDIRRWHAEGVKQSEIAKMLGISKQRISDVILGKGWTHV